MAAINLDWMRAGVQVLLLMLLSLSSRVYCTAAAGISCYQCENERSNFMCIGEENYVKCDLGMDTCQTIVSYSEVSAKLEITKTCTKNLSCELQVNATRQDYPCDMSRSSWICTTCCYGDGCNANVATATHHGSAHYAGALAGFLFAQTVAMARGRLG